MEQKIKLVFVNASLGAGGAERVLSIMANGFVERGHAVEVVTLNEGVPFFPLRPSVRVHAMSISRNSLNVFQAIVHNIYRIWCLRQKLKNLSPEAVVSFGTETNILVLLATPGLGFKVTVSERCDPHFYPASRIWKWLRRLVYPMTSTLVTQTKGASSYFNFMPKGKTHIIANPVQKPKVTGDMIDISVPFILAAGRLDRQKGFDILLDAFALMSDDFPDLKLVIVGEGDERGALKLQAQRLGVGDRVQMPGTVTNLGDYMGAACMFVLSSRYEGFPNALTEAMASGLAVVATDCPSGPSDIVFNGVNGMLVPPNDSLALAKALNKVMGDAGLRAQLGRKASEIIDNYSTDHILDKWELALDTNRPHKTHD